MLDLWSFLAPDQIRADGPQGDVLAPHRTDFNIEVRGPVCRIRVQQHLRNTTGKARRVCYLFPLAHAGALCRMAIVHGGRVIEGAVKERKAARRAFREARVRGDRAALLEEQRPNLPGRRRPRGNAVTRCASKKRRAWSAYAVRGPDRKRSEHVDALCETSRWQ